ncbi:Disease resistance protein [Nymphaea thermarum]|nr:Disease resistance protein [Nymphaea thermarum]
MRGAMRSKILITSPNIDVSKGIRALYMHRLPILPEEESWNLFLNKASRTENDLASHNLQDTAKKIVKKCGGLPLVVQTIGSLMRAKSMEKAEWEVVADSAIWDWKMPASSSSSQYGPILPGLILSYDDLPPYLSSCFVYCSIFPKDHEIEREGLIMQWVAHGLIEEKEAIDVEVTANQYLEDLIRGCLIEETHDRFYGGTYLKLHDILHDLASYIGGKEYSHASATELIRHLSLLGVDDVEDAMQCNTSGAANKARTLLLIEYSRWDEFINFKWLRVLSLRGYWMDELPNSIECLSLLKYLDLSWSEVSRLPRSIGKLFNLQTLDLSYSKIEELPEEMGELCNLRYLGLERTQSLQFMAEGLGWLTNLLTLHRFMVCHDKGDTRGCNIRELKDLNKLKGELLIEGLGGGRVKVIDAEKAQLMEKHELIGVKLEFKLRGLLEALEPPHGIERLRICDYEGDRPAWYLVTNYVELRTLLLRHCPLLATVIGIKSMEKLEVYGSTMLKTLTNMPALESLKVRDCGSLEQVAEMPELRSLEMRGSTMLKTLVNMPALESLKVRDCGSLEQVAEMPALRSLEVHRSTMLKTLANMPALESLKVKDCGSLEQIAEMPALRSLEVGGSTMQEREKRTGAEMVGVIGALAETAISNLLGAVTNLLKEKADVTLNANNDLKNLQEKLKFYQKVIKDADCKPFLSSERGRELEGDFKDVLYDAEDIIEEYRSQIEVTKKDNGSTSTNKDQEIEREGLIMQWVAHGLIEEKEEVGVEVTANQYIEDLIRRCLIEETHDRFYRGIYVKLHDILHDLASYIGGKEYSHASATEHTRHLSLLGVDDAEAAMQCNTSAAANKLWTLLEMDELPNSIEFLLLLKYHDLSWSEVRQLPKSIGKLCNLQTLNLSYSKIEELPKEMGKLCNLRYLGLERTDCLTFIAEGLGKLTNLRTLHRFLIRDDKGDTRGCNIRELKDLNKLKGELLIEGLGGGRVKVIDPEKAQLKENHELIGVKLEFKLKWDYEVDSDSEMGEDDEVDSASEVGENDKVDRASEVGEDDKVDSASNQRGLLEALEPPHGIEVAECSSLEKIAEMPALRSLEVGGCNMVKTLANIPALESSVVRDCGSLEQVAEMPALRSLNVYGCNMLKTLANMPALELLESLKVGCCDSLEQVAEMPELMSLEVRGCNMLETLTNMPALESLELADCGSLEHVAEMPALKSLSVFRCNMLKTLDNMLAFLGVTLANMPALELLDVAECGSLEQVAEMPALRSLVVEQLSVMPAFSSLSLKQVAEMPALTSLIVFVCDMLKTLANMSALDSLSVTCCDSLEQLAEMPTLRSLEMVQCNRLKTLANMPNLIELKLEGP